MKVLRWYILMIFLPGCMVGPRYKRPSVKLPAQYDHQQSSSTKANLARWWTFFDDESLNDLITTALKNNYDLRIALEKIEETRALYRVQRANLFPEVGVVGLANRTQFSCNTAQFSFINQNPLINHSPLAFYYLGFDAYWELDVWGKLRRARNSAYDQFQAQIEAMRDVYIMVLADVARTYVEYRSTQQRIDLLEDKLNVTQALSHLSQSRFNAGLKSALPELESQIAVDKVQTNLIALQTLLAYSTIRIATLLGENPEGFIIGEGRHAVPASHKKVEVGLPSDLLRRRPDIRRAERLLASATEDVGVAVADWFPSFSLLGAVGAASSAASCLLSPGSLTWTIGPAMLWRLITFGRIRYTIQAKESAKRQALLKYAQSVVKALEDVERSLVSYFDGKEQVELATHTAELSRQQRDLYAALWDSGLKSETDYLNAVSNHIDVCLRLVDAQEIETTALISVYKALGGGW